MTARTFTPGPWTACRMRVGDEVAAFHITAAPHGSLDPVAETGKTLRPAHELNGNAALIAAAPDMLIEVLCEVIHGDGTDDSLQRTIDASNRILKELGFDRDALRAMLAAKNGGKVS